MRREKKLAKALVSLFISEEEKKLSDKYHNLKLSHNRLHSLVRQFVKAARSDRIDMNYFNLLVLCAEAELRYLYYRQNWGYQHKQEPGHYCE